MKPIRKTIKTKEECYIDFTDEEMELLNLSPGDKFTWKLHEDGVMLEKHVPIELDIDSWDKHTLLFLIKESCDKDISVNEVIADVLEQCIRENESL